MRFLAALLFTCLLSFTAASQTTKTKPPGTKTKAASKPRAAATPKKIDEKSQWEAAIAIAEPATRHAELTKFIETYPDSSHKSEALVLISSAAAESGNERLQAGDVAAASSLFKNAAAAAPSPIPDQLFNETLSKLPANLYFRGDRQAAIEIAKILEEKAATSASQLLGVANFYLSIEAGSEAKRVAEKAIVIDPASSSAYETLGLAHRMDFELERSAAAYAKAVDLAPDSLTARRGLAEMNRSLGRSSEAAELYRDILQRDESSVPARTGLVLALFDAGDRAGAEIELTRALEANPNNVMLLAGAAYWYAANKEGARAVELARKSIESDPRFIWSHIALSRGYLASGDPISAEKTLIAARRYGNFPTLEYEIASARLAAGLYREAGEELAKSFRIVDGSVQTRLGGRVERSSKDITELVGYERRASIFTPTAADDPESATRLVALLELKQELEKPEPAAELAVRAADNFIKGDDKMRVHRQIFAAGQLLEKKLALPRVVEIARDATANVDAGLDITSPSTTVMASELYEPRSLAAIRNEYVTVPDVPRSTLSAILRGRIEEINGWAAYQMQDPAESVLRLRRAISVLPVNSAWWRSSTWRLGSALELAGKSQEALDMYIKSYKSENSVPDSIKYSVISALYHRLNGSTEGLEERINAVQPEQNAQLVAQKREAEPTAQQPAVADAQSTAAPTPNPAPFGNRRVPAVVPIATPIRTPAADVAVVEATPEQTPVVALETPRPIPEATPAASLLDTPAVIPPALPEGSLQESLPPSPIATAEPSVEATPAAEIPAATPEATPQPTETPTPAASPEITPGPPPEAPPEKTPTDQPLLRPEPTPEATTTRTPIASSSDNRSARSTLSGNDLFPPVVITIPQRPAAQPKPSAPIPTPSPEIASERVDDPPPPLSERVAQTMSANRRTRARVVIEGMVRPTDLKACNLTVSEESITLQTGGRDVAVVVGRDDDGDLDGLTAVSASPSNVSVRREPITGVSGRALFVLRSISENRGSYQASFEMPCGRRDILVTVR